MAQDLFSNVLAKANIPNGVSVETVHLSRENHRLSVCLRAGERLSDVQCESLVRLLSDYLPGVSVGLDVRSDAAEAMAPATSQAKVMPRPAPSQKPAQAAASTPKQTADGVRILYGTSIKTHQRVRVHDLAEGDAMVVIEGVLVSAEMREGWKGKDGRTSYRVQLNVTDYTDSVYCVCTFYEEVKAQRFYDWVSPLPGQRDQAARARRVPHAPIRQRTDAVRERCKRGTCGLSGGHGGGQTGRTAFAFAHVHDGWPD